MRKSKKALCIVGICLTFQLSSCQIEEVNPQPKEEWVTTQPAEGEVILQTTGEEAPTGQGSNGGTEGGN